ncbi:MAG: beta-ketoacyl synthase N-terminal-like domain-containing protein, partial [Candidatus Acidiferrales bacterium]
MNLADSWNALSQGRCAIGPLKNVDRSRVSLKMENGAEVQGFDPTQHFEGGKEAYLDRFAQFSVVAARQAIRDSGLDLTPALRYAGAVICGSAVGGQSAIETGFADLYVSDRGRVHPLTIPKTMANAGASHISMELGITGPTYTVSTACSSANHAIGQA